jgi:hypothetical protein
MINSWQKLLLFLSILFMLLLNNYGYGSIIDDIAKSTSSTTTGPTISPVEQQEVKNANPLTPQPALISNLMPQNPLADSELEPKTQYIYSDWEVSIMFDNEKIKQLNKALKNFKEAKLSPPPIFTGPINNANTAPKINSILDLASNANVSPSFYLGSIIFNNANDWVIWINNKKLITAKKADLKFSVPGLEIIGVKDNYVSFNWGSRNLDLLSPNWQKKLTYNQKNGQYTSNNKKIAVNNNVITFSLYPNQSFSVYDMAIVEGYKKDTKISSTPISSEKPS